ncbi:hypothetical protein F4802DRAFT_487357 [Xylaria palmicola]|nr:hypothetical protein F4802DRAFT_487357 [Xylaria palmicola]
MIWRPHAEEAMWLALIQCWSRLSVARPGILEQEPTGYFPLKSRPLAEPSVEGYCHPLCLTPPLSTATGDDSSDRSTKRGTLADRGNRFATHKGLNRKLVSWQS